MFSAKATSELPLKYYLCHSVPINKVKFTSIVCNKDTLQACKGTRSHDGHNHTIEKSSDDNQYLSFATSVE